jgi:hypothetical protein
MGWLKLTITPSITILCHFLVVVSVIGLKVVLPLPLHVVFRANPAVGTLVPLLTTFIT